MTISVARSFTSPLAAGILAALIAFGGTASAESPEEKGLAIAEEAARRDDGYTHYAADQTMVLKNRQGQESSRAISIKVLEVQEDGDKSLIVFNNPRDVKGTALLTHSHKVDDDDQWLYLPALKRVKRISSSNKAGSFMGSEFAYEDMTSQEVEKYDYRFVGEEPCGELTCFVVERFPTDKNSGYKRQVAWIDTEHYRTWRVEFFDRKNAHLKTLTTSDYQLYKGQFWRPGRMFMENHLTGKTTLLTWTNYDFDTPLRDNQFTKVGLKRAR